MRLRITLLAVASSFALALSASTPAYAVAAEGSFLYGYTDQGERMGGTLDNPTLGQCYNIPLVSTDYVFGPNNTTDAIADVYEELGCEGDPKATLASEETRPDEFTFRSVMFRATP
ncbi:hypothetical protein [Streptomyces sp. NPDC053079]|uniref:hypothetical protein n=1 Tax=Streptomyces sp. NPDC053079 TaxID=3365697 RepID=UPI0037CEBAEC